MIMGRDDEWTRGDGWTTAWGAGADEDDDWLDDASPEDEWPDGEPSALPGGPLGPGPRYWRGWGHGGVPGFSAWIAVTVAVVAGVAGVAAGFFLTRGAPVASAAGGVFGATPSVSAPASVPAS